MRLFFKCEFITSGHEFTEDDMFEVCEEKFGGFYQAQFAIWAGVRL
jgi:hypothetical protein